MTEKLKTNTDTNFLKLIGIITMTIDHIGLILFPNISILRVIGRIAFPIFAYGIAVGSVYTKDIKKYLLRLAILAVLFQVVYTLRCLPDWTNTFFQLNIFFTLSFGLACIIGIQQKKWWLTAICLIASFFLNIDYGYGGVLLIITFYIFRNKPLISAIMVAPQLLCMQIDRFLIYGLSIQSFSIFSMPFIYMKTNFNLKINKYVFYVFYPLHFLVLYLISIF